MSDQGVEIFAGGRVVLGKAPVLQEGVDSNLGKCRAYGRSVQPAPADIASLGHEVWRSDRPNPERGIKILGTPVGSAEFVTAHLQMRLQEEQQLRTGTWC